MGHLGASIGWTERRRGALSFGVMERVIHLFTVIPAKAGIQTTALTCTMFYF
jgi:hypothetical protein